MADLLTLLFGVALGTIGATGFAIFGPLTVRHLADRGAAQEMDGSCLSAAGLRWILLARHRGRGDRRLSGLATPATIMLWLVVIGLLLLAIRLLLAWAD